jgi:hypothetical protein
MTRNDKIAEISLIGHVKVPVIKKTAQKNLPIPHSKRSCEAQHGQSQMVGTCSTHRAEEKWIKKKVHLENLGQGCTGLRGKVVKETKLRGLEF